MIQKVDISHFGNFRGFVWKDALRDSGNNVAFFKKLNIIYGRNYSGKTCLSRIVRSMETRRLPANFASPVFVVGTSAGDVSPTALGAHGLDVRVYNSDFVDEHLAFLRDAGGHILPFAVLGVENKELDKEIRETESKIGSAEPKVGLRGQVVLATDTVTAKREVCERTERLLESTLTRKATDRDSGIKYNSEYGDASYATPKLKKDIEHVRANKVQIKNQEDWDRLIALLKDEPLPDLVRPAAFRPSFSSLLATATGLLQKRFAPTQPVQELLSSPELQSWVKQGMGLHKDVRDDCGFCGGHLDPQMWTRLAAHFDKQAEKLDGDLRVLRKDLEREHTAVGSIKLPDRNDVYSDLQDSLSGLAAGFQKGVVDYQAEIVKLMRLVDRRLGDIFTVVEVPDMNDYSASLSEYLSKCAELIYEHGKKTASLADDQQQARIELRLAEVAKFIQDVNLEKLELDFAEAKVALGQGEVALESVRTTLGDEEVKLQSLRAQLKDERRGAEQVNLLLSHHFGHESLKLVAVEEAGQSTFRFQVMRGAEIAHNLSEGECSLVAFCYFMAKLKDVDSAGKELVIFIDDPISSLDSNHIFFVYSLILDIIAKPTQIPNASPAYAYKQLFISTHNLDFLKYLKRLPRPKNDSEHFLVERTPNGSRLQLMPPYLKDYTTEFNYLFHQILKSAEASSSAPTDESHYNFGNNLRKFLEAYLFYKYPNHEDIAHKLRRFFGEDGVAVELATRLENELSHLEEMFDRSVKPVESHEIGKLAQYVMRALWTKDPDQFEALMKSIDRRVESLTFLVAPVKVS